jgi:prune family protein 2
MLESLIWYIVCTGLGEPPPARIPIPELSATEERTEARSWRSVVVAGLERRIDMKVIEPYKRVSFTMSFKFVSASQKNILFLYCKII